MLSGHVARLGFSCGLVARFVVFVEGLLFWFLWGDAVVFEGADVWYFNYAVVAGVRA